MILKTKKLKLYNNMKTTIATIIVFVLIVLGLYFLYTSESFNNYLNQSTNESLEKASENEIRKVEFDPFTKYIRKNLSEEERSALKEILRTREEKLAEIEQILAGEFEKSDADMGAAFIKVAEIREAIKNQLAPYIDPSKMADFEEKYNELGRDIESRYVTK